MKKIYTLFVAMCATLVAFAATEQAWYNDVTSITSGGQYYIYSVNGAGFMEAGNSQVITATTSKTPSLFTIANPAGGTVKSGDYYLKSFKVLTGSTQSGPTVTSTGDGTKIIWTSMNGGTYWNIHGNYNYLSLGQRYAGLYYEGGKYDAEIPSGSSWGYSDQKDTHTENKYRWYVISQAQYACHWAIYAFDQAKEARTDYTKYENKVPAAFWTALADLCTKEFDVKTTTADEVNTAKDSLIALYGRADNMAAAYATGKAAIQTMEDADKGDDATAVTADINNAKINIEEAMTVEAINAAVVFKTLAPITFQATLEFDALTDLSNIATSSQMLPITYASSNETVVNAMMFALYAGNTTITASTAGDDTYYPFVRKAEVTIKGLNGSHSYSATICQNELPYSDENFTAVNEAGEQTKHLTTTTGGDSTLTFTLNVLPTYNENDQATICANELPFTWETEIFTEAGFKTLTLKTINNCDSIVTFTLTVLPTYNENLSATICANELPYTWETETFSEAGTKTLSLTSIYGCDSIINFTLNVLPVSPDTTVKDTFTVGETITWKGQEIVIPIAGDTTLADSLTNGYGCDSVVFHQIHVKPQTPTGICNTPTVEKQTVKKVIRNGEIFILRGKDLYDLTGRKQE